jgi:hypothetical protein
VIAQLISWFLAFAAVFAAVFVFGLVWGIEVGTKRGWRKRREEETQRNLKLLRRRENSTFTPIRDATDPASYERAAAKRRHPSLYDRESE